MLKQLTQTADSLGAETCLPMLFHRPHQLTVTVLCVSPLGRKDKPLPSAAGHLGWISAYPRVPRKLSDIAIASFDTPAMRGRSLTSTPSPFVRRRTLALMASDTSDSRSNSMAKESSTLERSEAREPVLVAAATGGRFASSAPVLNNP
jgi:hypothetical protein